MKLQHIPLDQIDPNPWRDKKLYPVSDHQLAGLRESIKDHGFFSSVKGRRVNGRIQIGCGHARLEAARKARLETMPVFLDDLDDDAMLRLMTDENALQSGTNPGAVMNEVAAVTRRLIEGLLRDGTIVPPVAKAFESKLAIEAARSKLRKGADVHIALGHGIIRRYLGQGDPDRAHRAERQIREAIVNLKQSGHYDDIVDETLAKFPLPVDTTRPAKKTEVAKVEQRAPRKRILDERCAHVFDNDHQFHAFRNAVTTQGAQRVLPVNEQYALAKSIVKDAKNKKDVTAGYVEKMVQSAVQDRLKAQRDINKAEKEQYEREQIEDHITRRLEVARMHVNSLRNAITILIELASKYPHHPKIAGFSAKLDDLVTHIKELARRL